MRILGIGDVVGKEKVRTETWSTHDCAMILVSVGLEIEV